MATSSREQVKESMETQTETPEAAKSSSREQEQVSRRQQTQGSRENCQEEKVVKTGVLLFHILNRSEVNLKREKSNFKKFQEIVSKML